ncbi:Fic family protein [Chitinophaga horti]|uniref:Fic family protein n=1 Tax=Chitinophaga horti TaxID=2920382 RepID=A0ABY6J410_9BACT|nr:Fic family protein [Chitinophaga horti]UYQ94401.1 Fic family protein [Chitinophaga horti]
MRMELQIIPTGLLADFKAEVDERASTTAFNALEDAELSTAGFSFYTSVASVYSSKIEGAEIELDSYIKHKRFGIQFQPDYTRKTDDLYTAYQYAQSAPFDRTTLVEAHKLLTRHILPVASQGKFRNQNMYVTTNDGRIEYVAASPFSVTMEMEKLYADITTLQAIDLSIAEVFYFASMIHLVFVKIHPWADGNGRSARLLEKWFLAVKLGEKAWFVQSEKYYYERHRSYYDNIQALRLEYDELDYANAGAFLRMLVAAVF